jgi:hypothetical protein
MSEPEPALNSRADKPSHSLLWRLFRPYDIGFYLMIILSWVGIIYSSADLAASRWYWHWLVPGFGVISVLTRWHKTAPIFKTRSLLILHEVLYWGGILILTYLIYTLASPNNAWIDLFDERQVSFLISFILATGTYLAGLDHDWRLCVVAAFILSGGLVNVVFSNLAPLLVWIGLGIVVVYFLWTWFSHQYSHRQDEKTLPTET